jgi:hypothetical protein
VPFDLAADAGRPMSPVDIFDVANPNWPAGDHRRHSESMSDAQ